MLPSDVTVRCALGRGVREAPSSLTPRKPIHMEGETQRMIRNEITETEFQAERAAHAQASGGKGPRDGKARGIRGPVAW